MTRSGDSADERASRSRQDGSIREYQGGLVSGMRLVSEAVELKELIRGVRSGDPEAAAELVRLYEPYVRRAVRVEMRDARLRRVFDSSDFCQSVLASFFVGLAHGQYQLDRPEQLLR